MLRASTSASSSGFGLPPPMYWKVPGSEKHERDYIVENMKHVRQVSSDVRKTKSRERLEREPLKVKFIPGLTKNPNYDHVESRISGLIKGTMKVGPREPIRNSNSSTSLNSKCANDLKPIWGASAAANARRIKSTSDMQKLGSSNTPFLRQFRRPAARKPHPESESVYNWHFSDTNNFSPHFTELEKQNNPAKFAHFMDSKDLHLHRVEYLPCDGICADEHVFPKNGDNGSGDCGSGRSSRGINTEETRIFTNSIGNLRSSQSLTRLDEKELDDPVRKPHPARFIATVQQQTENLRPHQQQLPYDESVSSFNGNGGDRLRDVKDDTDPFVERIKQNMSEMQLNGAPPLRQGYVQPQTDWPSRNVDSGSSQVQTPPRRNHNGYTDTSPHKTGAIPKYLKKRQQQWKEQELARQEAEKAASIPPGHVAMSDVERLENLAKLQSTYDNLVNELNRVPIRIDTIRVREYKHHLEQELSKLEQAMRLFSRPTLYVKLDQQ